MATATLGPSQPAMTILEVAQYADKPMFGLKKAKSELPGRFDRNPVALNTWLFEIEQCCQIFRLNRSTDMVKLAIFCLEKDVHT